MKRWMRCALGSLGLGLGFVSAGPLPPVTEGMLVPRDPYSKNTGEACPLKHTQVDAEIAGFVSRVSVLQEFQNKARHAIEAVYVFPLPAQAAVDRMEIRIGARVIRAVIKKRAEARRDFEEARNAGRTAALLDQERPNVFTQSVTNIPAGATVKVFLSYVETLKYEEGQYEWSFPMVVGPRYIPASGVKDSERITPQVAPPGTRAGHDLSLTVRVDAGTAIQGVRSATHEIATEQPTPQQARVTLAARSTIPNQDFVLRYAVAGPRMQDAQLFHRNNGNGYFTLILHPPARHTVEDVTPKELVFVLDTSGSMSGFPMEKAKETMRLALAGLYPRDRFNFITFAGDTRVLFPGPVAANAGNVQKALAFLDTRAGAGGTEMMKAIRAALAPGEPGKLRIVCFMTDGYVGNEGEILAEIRKHAEARIFSFGIGSSVNRFLLDKMAMEGRGEVEYVGLQDDGSAAARRFHERVRNPLLTGITVDWGGLPVTDVYPQRIPDLFSAQPVVLQGRFQTPASGTIRLRGSMSGKPFERIVRVSLPASEPAHTALASLWARTKIDALMSEDWLGLHSGRPSQKIEEQVTQLGLQYGLMTQFTSFVAVDTQVSNSGGKPVVVETPLEMPAGVSPEGVFGSPAALARGVVGGVPGGVVGGLLPASKGRLPGDWQLAAPAPPTAPTKLSPLLRTRLQDYVRNGQIQVEIWLTDATPEALAALRQLGFVLSEQPKVAKVVTGTLPAAKLKDLEALAHVVWIGPRQSNK